MYTCFKPDFLYNREGTAALIIKSEKISTRCFPERIALMLRRTLAPKNVYTPGVTQRRLRYSANNNALMRVKPASKNAYTPRGTQRRLWYVVGSPEDYSWRMGRQNPVFLSPGFSDSKSRGMPLATLRAGVDILNCSFDPHSANVMMGSRLLCVLKHELPWPSHVLLNSVR